MSQEDDLALELNHSDKIEEETMPQTDPPARFPSPANNRSKKTIRPNTPKPKTKMIQIFSCYRLPEILFEDLLRQIPNAKWHTTLK